MSRIDTPVNIPGHYKPNITKEKICDYLLSPIHPIGKFKAKFFCSLGYSQARLEELSNDIAKVLANGMLEKVEDTLYGTKYTVSGGINSPSGKVADIVTVWIVRKGGSNPHLITAYPGVKT